MTVVAGRSDAAVFSNRLHQRSVVVTDLLLVLQKLMLLVLVKLLELLELAVLLQDEMSLVLLQVTAYRPLKALTRCTRCSAAAATWNNRETLSAQRHSLVFRGSVGEKRHSSPAAMM